MSSEQTIDQITYIDRSTNKKVVEQVPGGNFMKFLYGQSPLGNLTLNGLFKRKFISSVFGGILNMRISSLRVKGFIEKYNMDMSQYIIPDGGYKTFNDFFYRHIKPGARPIKKGIVSPADGKLLVFQEINQNTAFFVKGSDFSVETLLNSKELAEKYEGGSMCIVRLAPTDYHRYHFPVSGFVGENIRIRGDYFSVSPLALKRSLAIFCRNKREYSIIKTPAHGDVVFCDIGATMTGGIIQSHQQNSNINKGDEKGYFAFGGSTVVLLFEKGKIQFSQDLIENTKNGYETAILMGDTIGE